MANLRDRLSRIRENKELTPAVSVVQTEIVHIEAVNKLISEGWEICGYNVIKRKIITEAKYNFLQLHFSISIIIPDIYNCENKNKEDFIFLILKLQGLEEPGQPLFLLPSVC